VPDYLFREMRRADAYERVHPRPVIIVEGILVLADPRLRGLFDASAYVHTPDDIRLIRRIRRDVAERSRDVEHVLAQYEATVRPMHEAFVAPSRGHAQLVLDGLADPTVSEARLLQLLPRP
jgi:uridine kinase